MTLATSKAFQELSERGITLEEFVEHKARMRRPTRIESEQTLQELLAHSDVEDPSLESKIAPPDPSVTLVLDGKRVEYDAIAALDGRPLDYVYTTSVDGRPILVAFSDRSIMKANRLRQFKGAMAGINADVAKSLAATGLRTSTPVPRGINLGGRIFEEHFFRGGAMSFAPDEGAFDLSEYDDGLGVFGGDWNDKISSIQMGRCRCEAWEHRNHQGASITFWSDVEELDTIGWNDRISCVQFMFNGF